MLENIDKFLSKGEQFYSQNLLHFPAVGFHQTRLVFHIYQSKLKSAQAIRFEDPAL